MKKTTFRNCISKHSGSIVVLSIMSQVTTITFFRFSGFKNKLWAFTNMRNAGKLKQIAGLTFFKLMGSGRGLGFNAWPDWGVYVLLQVWENDQAACDFFENHEFINECERRSQEMWRLYMHNVKADGMWDGNNPFASSQVQLNEDTPLAVITRATIKWSRLAKFWSFVSISQRPLKQAKGLIYTKGIGEVPVKQMATFSLWNSFAAVKAFAYNSAEHKEAIKRTNTLKWYSEEMFARFVPFKSIGRWNGKNPLPLLDEAS